MNHLTTPNFIAGYKHHPDLVVVYWLCNHPESLDLLFSQHKTKAFVFEDKQAALNAMTEILIAENHAWYAPVVETLQPENSSPAAENQPMNLPQLETKINGFLTLFNERSNSGLKLFLTLNKKDNSIRGYGTGFKLGDAVINFVALLAIKGLKARCLDKYTFVVEMG